MYINKYIVSEQTSVIEVMRIIDSGARGIAFVCENGKLLATVTDGDIRRFIIQRGDLNSPVCNIANYHPIFIGEFEKEDKKHIMKKKEITALPIVNDKGVLVDIYFVNTVLGKHKKSLEIPVVIMAGGKGTRLQPYTQILPKPLIPIGDKTITEHIIERFEGYGCNHFDIIVNYKKNLIMSYFQDNKMKHDINFICEEEYRGTGGGLRLLKDKYRETFFVSNCDVLIDDDYYEMVKSHKAQRNIITMVCTKKKFVIPYGTVELSDNGHVTKLKEKPEFDFMTNTGLYIVEPDFLCKIPEKEIIHITDVIQKCIDLGENVGVYPIDDDAWMDMGQFDELERMRLQMESKERI